MLRLSMLSKEGESTTGTKVPVQAKYRQRLRTIDAEQQVELLPMSILKKLWEKETPELNDAAIDDIIQKLSAAAMKGDIAGVQTVKESLIKTMNQKSSNTNHHNFKQIDRIFNAIMSLEKEAKMGDIRNYDQIVKKKFKKEKKAPQNQYETQYIKSQKSDSNESQSKEKRSSCDSKLNKLLSLEKDEIKKKQWKENEMSLQQLVNPREESISFSDVLATSCVRQRPNKPTMLKQSPLFPPTTKTEDNSDMGFCFYRPRRK